MNTQEYLKQISQINQSLVQDPRTLLALTVAWIDPMAILQDQELLEDEELSDYYYAHDALGGGIHVTRTCFPDIYVSAINQLRQGQGYRQVLDFIDEEIERQTGICVTEYGEGYAYVYGIPLPWYGFDMEDPDLQDRDDEWHLASIFGIGVVESASYMQELTAPDNVRAIAYVLRWSLWEYRHSPLHETLMWAIAYVFSSSQNSSVDYTYEVACEWQPLTWTPEDVDFAITICQEAGEIMQHAVIGLATAYDPAIKRYLQKQIGCAAKHVKQSLDQGENIYDLITDQRCNPFNLRWDDLRTSVDDETDAGVTELSIRLGVA